MPENPKEDAEGRNTICTKERVQQGFRIKDKYTKITTSLYSSNEQLQVKLRTGFTCNIKVTK